MEHFATCKIQLTPQPEGRAFFQQAGACGRDYLHDINPSVLPARLKPFALTLGDVTMESWPLSQSAHNHFAGCLTCCALANCTVKTATTL